jgi:hypothetical protein
MQFRLRELREARGLALTDLYGVPQNQLQRLEEGLVAKPRAEHMMVLAIQLGIQPADLVCADDHSTEADAVRRLRVRHDP